MCKHIFEYSPDYRGGKPHYRVGYFAIDKEVLQLKYFISKQIEKARKEGFDSGRFNKRLVDGTYEDGFKAGINRTIDGIRPVIKKLIIEHNMEVGEDNVRLAERQVQKLIKKLKQEAEK